MYGLKNLYGDLRTLGDIAGDIAAAGQPPCQLAAPGEACSVVPVEPQVDHWATLYQALHGEWECTFFCERRHAALKKAESCPPIRLDVRSLVAVLGYDYKLAKLYRDDTLPDVRLDALFRSGGACRGP
ncbi:MAG: hypothetical protein WDN31_05325 [Hyphomicrobium sp.]